MLRSLYLRPLAIFWGAIYDMKNRLDGFLDKIYEKRSFYLRYLVIAMVLSIVRYFIAVLMSGLGFVASSGDLIAWLLWGALFYAPIKLWAFKNHCDNVYYLLTQLALYIMCITALWVVRSFILSALVLMSNNPAVAFSIGGVIVELICLGLMINVVFKKKKT